MSCRAAAHARLFTRYGVTNRTSRQAAFWTTTRCSSTNTRQWSTPLAKSLAEAITTTGPIPIASYMRQCLTSPEGGYYGSQVTADKDQFGKRGDFITSPEISQIFGELVGIWFLAEWMSQGKRTSGVELIELGPGRGTLMDDVLRTIRNFKPMAASIETIYLVESSKALRENQKRLLCGDAPVEEIEIGYQSTSKFLPNTRVIWLEDINFKPREAGKTPFIIAHEFFDALPIHAFQSATEAKPTREPRSGSGITTSTGPTRSKTEWRELLVSPTAPPSVINPPKTPLPEFELTLSKAPTQHSLLLPTLSPRYKSLLPTPGSTIEISPTSNTIMTNLTQLIGKTATKPTGQRSSSELHEEFAQDHPSGAALIVDYGPTSTVPISTLRGIQGHKTCSPFEKAGEVDLSVDVDFGALIETALSSSEEVEVHGPVEQGDWLKLMGGKERCDALVSKAKSSGDKEAQEIADRIESGWNRLVSKGPNGMGKVYKALAVIPVNKGTRRPVGFGGDV